MTLIERYVLRTAATAFTVVCLVLTGVIWITQALREIELLTSKGQTALMFFTVTLLSIPTLVAIIAPIALFIAVLSTLNKLNGDSELIVMSASGLSPARLVRPFAALGVAVAVLVGALTILVIPDSFRSLRNLITQIRADVVTKVAQEGQFTQLDSGVVFHFRERQGDALLGVFLQDARDASKATIYLAERGRTATVDGASLLVLERGSVQRQQAAGQDPAIVTFDTYAVDLSQLADEVEQVVYKPRERSTGELLDLDETNAYVRLQAGRFRAELHDRFAAPLFPFACMAIAFAALGNARTTRQGRTGAIFGAVVAIVALRVAIFAASGLVVRHAWAVPLLYLIPVAVTLGAGVHALRPDLPRRLIETLRRRASPPRRLAGEPA